MKQAPIKNGTATSHDVDLFGSHPDLNNDDCWTGFEFATLDEARAYLAAPTFPNGCPAYTVAYFLLNSPDAVEVHANPLFRASRNDDREWKSEMRMEAAMLHGVEGWNDFDF